ncbi:MAG: hypothetical protein IJ932_04315 [Ruminococcus sp.]|nr:hypothetical protein [Ruminococcus sp.]
MKKVTAILLSALIVLSTIFYATASVYDTIIIVLTEKASKQVVDGELTINTNYFKKYNIEIKDIYLWEPETQMEISQNITFSIVLGKNNPEYSEEVIKILKQDENFMFVAHGVEKRLGDSKSKNPMKVTTKTKVVKYNKVKKAKQTVAPITVKKAVGKVTYKKLSGSKKLLLKANGKIVVKKGTKKGTYTAKIKVTAKGNANYKSASKTVKIKIKVK